MSAEKPAQIPQIDTRVQKLLTLLTLLKNARHKEKTSELAFLMVNQTFNLVSYRHCIFWRYDGEYVYLEAVSGLVQMDPLSPYCLWMKKALRHIVHDKEAAPHPDPKAPHKPGEVSFSHAFALTAMEYHGPEPDEWKKWVSVHAVFLPMRDSAGRIAYGLWLDRDQPFTEMDQVLLEDLADGYAHAIHLLETDVPGKKARTSIKEFFRLRKTPAKVLLLGLVFALFLPVRFTITAPAEVVASSPTIISIPFSGILERVAVEPNQPVREGDILAVMDSTALKSRYELAERELATAEAALTKTEREALRDPEKRMEINILKSQIRAKETEREFAKISLQRASIAAPESGIAIFSDPNALRGKPVDTGEQIMLLADPKDTELLVRVPVDAMVEIAEEIPVQFFLNVSPIGAEKANIKSVSYQATPDADGVLSYKIRARFTDTRETPRVGWTGTAKVYGKRTLLVINVLRRPFIAFRRMTGL